MATEKQIEFGRPVELNDAWLKKHEDHSLIWIKHTVFKGMKGTEYQECRCYTCGEIARTILRSVTTKPEPKPSPPKKDRKPNFTFGYTSYGSGIRESAEALRFSGWM